MRSTDALDRLRKDVDPFFTTRMAAAILGIQEAVASDLLQRLASSHMIRKVRRGHWAIDPRPSLIPYGSWITHPLPSYVSLYSALYHHGLLKSPPKLVYVVSLDRTQTVDTDMGTYSVHQISPSLFRPLGHADTDGAGVATVEKAIFDTLYLERAISGKFKDLADVMRPSSFDFQRIVSYAQIIENAASRQRVLNAAEAFLVALKPR